MLLRSNFSGWVIGLWIAHQLHVVARNQAADTLRVLAFNVHRFPRDVELMTRHPSLEVYSFDSRWVEIVNAIFREPGHIEHPEYFLEDNVHLLLLRKRKQQFIGIIARHLRKRVDCAITPSIQYWFEQDFVAGFVSSGLLFSCLHKEFTVVDESQLNYRIELHKKRKQKFLGTDLYVTNDLARRLFVTAGVARPDQVHVIGSLRMDRLFDPDSSYRGRTNKRSQAVLFSFGHLSGGYGTNSRRSHYFSQHDDEGFVQLFNDVHGAFAETAIRNPDFGFTIKLKNHETWWINEIEAVVLRSTGRLLSDIQNLNIRNIDAPELIRDASCVVGFNSTVLLESAIIGRNTVIPHFAEATQHLSKYVYLKPFFDNFTVASSKTDLIEKIQIGLRDPDAFCSIDLNRKKEMVKAYLGFDDGKTLERLVKLMRTNVFGSNR